MGDANTALRTKGEEYNKLATECDLLAAQLAEQKDLLKKAQDEAEKKEAALMAEFESERSSWTDKEAMLASGFHEIEDIVDGKFLSFFRASDYVSGRLLIFRLASFWSWQTSSLVTRRQSLWPSRLLERRGGQTVRRSPLTPLEPSMSSF